MARKGRKQLTVLITEESFARLEEIKQETGLSNAKLVEMLIENYNSANINTSINTGITEERMREILKEELSCININTNINTKDESVNTNINTDTPKTKKPTKKKKEAVFVQKHDEEEDEPVFTERIDSVPAWQKKELKAQDFYGKVPAPYTKGEHDDDPLRYLDDEDEEPTTIKPKKIEEEEEEEEEVFRAFEY